MDKVYVATLAQTSTNAPVATELSNSLGALVWTRSSAGVYVGTLAGAFSLTRTTLLMPSMTDVVSVVVTDINTVTITMSGDGKLTAREIDIIVSTHYCTQLDLENKIGRTNLSQLANDTTGATIASPSVLDSILSNTDAMIDAKAGQVYTIPLTMPEAKITQIAIDLAIYACMLRRPVNMAMPKEWDDAKKAADKDLEDISNELLRLSDSQTVASMEANINTDNCTDQISFTDSNNQLSKF
jgi:phage gp36-like protein